MPVDVAWGNPEKTIIQIIIAGTWTWDEFYSIQPRTYQLLEQVSHPVCYIVDFTRGPVMPHGIVLERVQSVLAFDHEQSDLVLMVGINPAIHTMLSAIVNHMQRGKTHIITVNNLRDARLMAEKRLALTGRH